MRTGRPSLSRDPVLRPPTSADAGDVRSAQNAEGPVSFAPWPAEDAPSLTELRLWTLQRLTRMVEEGAITLTEFQAEKALVLRMTHEELAPAPVAAALDEPVQIEFGPSLLERLGPLQFGGAMLITLAAMLLLTRVDGPTASLGRAIGSLFI